MENIDVLHFEASTWLGNVGRNCVQTLLNIPLIFPSRLKMSPHITLNPQIRPLISRRGHFTQANKSTNLREFGMWEKVRNEPKLLEL